jgi:hypothetical protein
MIILNWVLRKYNMFSGYEVDSCGSALCPLADVILAIRIFGFIYWRVTADSSSLPE